MSDVLGSKIREASKTAAVDDVPTLRAALRECELFLRVLGLESEPAAKVAENARDALLAQPEAAGALGGEGDAVRSDGATQCRECGGWNMKGCEPCCPALSAAPVAAQAPLPPDVDRIVANNWFDHIDGAPVAAQRPAVVGDGLREYLQHHDWCAYNSVRNSGCTCGLTAALTPAATPVPVGWEGSVATVRVTHGGYAMELSTYVAYALPEGSHELFAAPQQGPVVAWTEKDGDEWVVYDADSDTGRHIAQFQKGEHYKSLFPIHAHPPQDGRKGEDRG